MLTQNEINALLEERRGYVVRGLKHRVAQVDEQLRTRGGVAVEDHVEAAAVEPGERAVPAKPRARKS